MIKEPLYLILILLGIVTLAQKISRLPHRSAILRILPVPVWCYMPPTILTTLGVLPSASPVYDWISAYVLPACLILLLMTTDLRSLGKISRLALTAMVVASTAVLAGGVGAFFMFGRRIGPEAWKAVGTLSASWIGGTMNMLAVKEATGLSEKMFTPLFLSDITLVYVWMMTLMIASSGQHALDRFLGADRKALNEALSEAELPKSQTKRIPMRSLLLLLLIGFGIAEVILWVCRRLPPSVISAAGLNLSTCTVILVTTAGLFLSATSFSKREGANANRIGYFLLYMVLAATGAKANLLAILKAPVFLAMGAVWIVIHAAVLAGGGRVFKIPSALLATASQANLGGVASAPVVASTYEPKLVPVALVLAILGHAIANYLALGLAAVLRNF